jgi:rhodanese-related sulfurtransferase
MLQSIFGYRQPRSTVGFRPQVQIKTIAPAELYETLNRENAPLVVDVRSPEEYRLDGHIAGSRLLPLPVLLQRSGELPKDQSIVFVCRSGNRSHIACEQLASQGFSNVFNMTGGMLGWHSAGWPSE